MPAGRSELKDFTETPTGLRSRSSFTASALSDALAELSALYGDLPISGSLQSWAANTEALTEINLLKRPDGTVYGFDLS